MPSNRDKEQKEDEFITFSFSIQRKRIPAFRSALMQLGDIVADELTKNLPYPKTQALTNAAIGVAAVRKVTAQYGYDEWYDR